MTETMADVIDAVASGGAAPDETPTQEELLRVIDRLRAIIDERWAETGILQSSLSPAGFKAALHTPFGSLLAHYCGTILRDENAPNFVGVEVDHPEDGAMVFCVHRRNGQSPLEQLAVARAESAALREERDRLLRREVQLLAERDGLRHVIRESLDLTRIAPSTLDAHLGSAADS